MKNVLVLAQLMIFVSAQNIIWNNDWAFNCDFVNHDLSNVLSRGEDCSSNCEKTPGCTHYTWSSSNGGTCWMKSGSASKSDAFYTPDNTVCGVINQPQDHLINKDEFVAGVSCITSTVPTDDQYNYLVSQSSNWGAITIKREMAMFLAQILWESAGLTAKRELACIVTGCPGVYNSGKYPYNKYPSQSYYGRGYIQLVRYFFILLEKFHLKMIEKQHFRFLSYNL